MAIIEENVDKEDEKAVFFVIANDPKKEEEEDTPVQMSWPLVSSLT